MQNVMLVILASPDADSMKLENYTVWFKSLRAHTVSIFPHKVLVITNTKYF